MAVERGAAMSRRRRATDAARRRSADAAAAPASPGAISADSAPGEPVALHPAAAGAPVARAAELDFDEDSATEARKLVESAAASAPAPEARVAEATSALTRL